VKVPNNSKNGAFELTKNEFIKDVWFFNPIGLKDRKIVGSFYSLPQYIQKKVPDSFAPEEEVLLRQEIRAAKDQSRTRNRKMQEV
jgi:hypothetical protein